jgi:hypothetical protein
LTKEEALSLQGAQKKMEARPTRVPVWVQRMMLEEK